MRWESLVSVQNLRLAWRRINTGRNLQHKRFFRDFYLVYETALDQNLRALRQQLLAHAWTPSHPQRVYIPKPSGLQRPISLLGVEDQIVLQAIANVFARKLAKKRKTVELSTVFSNILAEPSNSIFFTRPWQESYNAFQDKCRTLFAEGNHWIAHFDLAAFYDTISHDLLCRNISPKEAHPETWNRVKKWLGVWSSAEPQSITSHGIPQGPVASNFLAEAFFLPIDLEIGKKGIKYIRYVDDIRLFGASENDARTAGILLEWLCRDRGLIPQGKKFAVSRASSPEEALGSLPSIPPAEEDEERETMTDGEALRLLRSCVRGKPLRVTDKSRFRYVMYRAPKSTRILGKVMLLLPRHPEHVDTFVAYFGNYDKSRRIVEGLLEVLESGHPYPYVRGELWHLLARMGSPEQLAEALCMARADARDRRKCVGLSWGVMSFLIRCQEERLCRIGTRLQAESPLSRALLSTRIPQTEFAPGRVVASMLKGTLEEQLAAARQLQTRNITLSGLNLRQRELSEVCRYSLRSLGVIRRISKTARDWIAERLQKKYHGSLIPIWRKLLGAEYEHALQILIEADAMFEIAPASWLQLQDSFNDAVVRILILYLRQRGLPGGSQGTVGKDGRLVKYGNLLQPGGIFATAFPAVSASLLKVHERRSKLPGSHPYDEKGGAQNSWLKRPERDVMAREVCSALSHIASVIVRNP
ncbi:MAG TPA: reverse transcriptase domain-containing protein [Candidatus Hydrogenedentes bacterium]|nr:reverse transcriptase domain-containing protein [Candidatus Hydrogenedentota bacterium]